MIKYRFLISLIIAGCMILTFTIPSFAEDIDLDNGISISATLINGNLTINVTNNSGKDIGSVAIYAELNNDEGVISGTATEYIISDIKDGETKSLEPTMFIQNEYTSMTLYPCIITYTDYTRWGASKESITAAKELGKGFSIVNTTTKNVSNISNENSSIVLFVPPFSVTTLTIVAIALVFIKKNKKYKESDYYKETGISYISLRCDKGTYGEYLTRENLSKLDGTKRFLSNCYLTKQNGETTELDLIMIHNSGIYVFESKNYSGWIFGDETSKKWMQTLKNGDKNQFYNPIMQNRGHIRTLQNFLDLQTDTTFHSVIVFSDRCELKKLNVNTPVIHRRDVLKTVQNLSLKNPTALSDSDVEAVYQKLYPLTKVSDEVKAKHIQDIKNKI